MNAVRTATVCRETKAQRSGFGNEFEPTWAFQRAAKTVWFHIDFVGNRRRDDRTERVELRGVAKRRGVTWVVRRVRAVALRAQIAGNVANKNAGKNKNLFHIKIEWSRNEYAFLN